MELLFNVIRIKELRDPKFIARQYEMSELRL